MSDVDESVEVGRVVLHDCDPVLSVVNNTRGSFICGCQKGYYPIDKFCHGRSYPRRGERVRVSALVLQWCVVVCIGGGGVVVWCVWCVWCVVCVCRCVYVAWVVQVVCGGGRGGSMGWCVSCGDLVWGL